MTHLWIRQHIAWDASTLAGVIGYNCYATQVSGLYLDPPTDMGDFLDGFIMVNQTGTWYISVTAYTSSSETAHSAELVLQLPMPRGYIG